MAAMNDIAIRTELRLCKVHGKLGYFHCWEQYADVIFQVVSNGSHPGGQYSRVFGIVEFSDGVKRIDPSSIEFVDEKHNFLQDMNIHNEELA